MRKNKYGNKRTARGKQHFASKKEARRYDELCILQRAGKISALETQPRFALNSRSGAKIGVYIADFRYITAAGEVVVEDVKSEITAKNTIYRLKKKWVEADYGLKIKEL